MSRTKVTAILVLAACVAAAGARVFARQGPADPPAAKAEPGEAPAARWRYQSVRLVYESQIADRANEEAAKGWEVVQVVPVLSGNSGVINTQRLRRRPPGGGGVGFGATARRVEGTARRPRPALDHRHVPGRRGGLR